ncbi:conserved oligomeric Golgi complex subunit 8 isoform X2 [Thrips palmi]|uniref:Conserved oligomeric Golgi complex subunit 8 n=1 Tax=Thrips palmi TaxID=161013 RepID=A0A6P8YZF8_THRPL|nr:conserved oligomeric Golgi complex subunit 8 isoform X2 [Thrips palmi]
MDVDTENILKIVFPHGIKDEWRDNPEFIQYVPRLGSMSLDQLNKEPDRLTEDKAAVLAQTQDLAFANYKTFIRTAECSRDTFQKLNKSEESLESLLRGLPSLSQNCQEFVRSSSDINVHRRLNSLTLTRNAQLLEILELPQLMDTCIRNGNYEDALELAAYVRRLGKKHFNIPIIANVVNEVETAWLSMLQQLLSTLRTDLPLPSVLQIVGYLRRMELFSEVELRLKFLQCRDSWLQAMLTAIPKEDALHHLSRTVELSRVHLFSIITQYRAVFGDSEADISHSSSNYNTLFYSWIMEKVMQFLSTLEKDLAHGVGSSLDSVVRQCMYFGLSLSRVGADFRGLLAPIFVKALQQSIEVSIVKATRKFEQDMENFTLPKIHSSIARSLGSMQDSNEHPPEILLEFRPLADYCNAIIMCFNDIRLCAPVALAAKATSLLQESLCSVAKSMLTFYRQEQQALTSTEKEAFTRFCACMADHLLPFLQRCLHVVFPSATIATHLGVNVHQLQKEHITFLDRSIVLDSISHLLPVKVELPPLQNLHLNEASPPSQEEVTVPSTLDSTELKVSSTSDTSSVVASVEPPPLTASSQAAASLLAESNE